MWRNWQTRMVQVHVLAREWRFKSSHPHQSLLACRRSLQNTPIDVQSLKWIDFDLLRWSAQQRLLTVLGASPRCSKRRPSYELENLALRQQLAVLRRSGTPG